MHGSVQPGVDARSGGPGPALGPWGGATALIEAYEAAVTSAVAAQQDLARTVAIAPVRSLLALYADLVRDVAAVQVSAARWVLDA